jgi:hypothetical protein
LGAWRSPLRALFRCADLPAGDEIVIVKLKTPRHIVPALGYNLYVEALLLLVKQIGVRAGAG